MPRKGMQPGAEQEAKANERQRKIDAETDEGIGEEGEAPSAGAAASPGSMVSQ